METHHIHEGLVASEVVRAEVSGKVPDLCGEVHGTRRHQAASCIEANVNNKLCVRCPRTHERRIFKLKVPQEATPVSCTGVLACRIDREGENSIIFLRYLACWQLSCHINQVQL